MSEAAVVVQNLLETQKNLGFFKLDPARVSNSLVAMVWVQKPDIFNGRFGQRPHKLSVAAVALACGIEEFAADRDSQLAAFVSLGTVLQEFEVNGALYPFNGIDGSLQRLALDAYLKNAGENGLLER